MVHFHRLQQFLSLSILKSYHQTIFQCLPNTVDCHFTASGFFGKVSQQTRKVSQQSGNLSQQSGKVSKQVGKVSQQVGNVSQQTIKVSQQTEKVSQHLFAVK